MAVIDKFLAKQHGTSLRAASSGARGVHLSVRVLFIRRVIPFRPSVARSCGQKKIRTTWPIHF
jgi:hypothetical protein